MLIDRIAEYFSNSIEFDVEISNRLKRAVLLNAQNVANYIMQENDKEFFDIQKDFPACSPPWETYGVYWKMPKWTRSKERGIVNRGIEDLNIELFILVHSVKNDDGWDIVLSVFLDCQNHDSVYFLGFEGLPIDKNGTVSISSNSKIPIGIDPAIVEKFGVDMINLVHQEARNVVLMSNCFCNCKNVEKVSNHIPHALIKRRRRDNKVNITKFYTLNISPTINAPSSNNFSGFGSGKSLHICRGHFKHFTQEKPLMGKHVGTYWWAMHTKGSAAVGEVKKDYQIKL